MKTVLNVKTDADVKKDAQALAKHLGVPLSVVVNSYLKEFVRSGEFTLSREPKLKPAVAKRLEKAVAETRKGVNVSPAFDNAQDAVAWLRS